MQRKKQQKSSSKLKKNKIKELIQEMTVKKMEVKDRMVQKDRMIQKDRMVQEVCHLVQEV